MQPGDLILVSPLHLSGIPKQIMAAQELGGYAPEDARWYHAAVYVGASVGLCEATRKGVNADHLYDYVGKHLFRVRRDTSMHRETGWEIAVNALVRLNTPYSFRAIGKILRRAADTGLWKSQKMSAHEKEALICSQLYSEAYSMATGKTLWNKVGKEVTPAYLSQTPVLTDIPLRWLRIGSKS